MASQGPLRSASARSTSSFDSLDEFLSEFEVINKDDQQALPAPLPLLHQSGDNFRPPRPSVRLSMQPYTATRQGRRQSQGSTPAEAAAHAAPGGYQNLALLPVSEPCGMDAGHLFDAFPGHARSNRAYGGGEGTPVQTAPMSPLSNYAEQLQRDLGSSTGSLPPQPPQFNLAASCPAPFGQAMPNQGPSSGHRAAAQQSMPVFQMQSTGPPPQTASRPAASISSAEGAAFTNPLMSMPGRYHVEPAVAPVSPPSSQRPEGRSSRAHVGARAEQNAQPAAAKQARQHAAAREGIHPLSRSFETLLKEPVSGGPPQQRPHAAHAAAANIPSSPVPSTVRVAQQTLRKRDYESELLDRLLNSAQAAAPVQGQQAPPAATKQPASCLHLPVPRVLLITVVFALMAIPLLLFTAGRVQAQHHMKQQQVYVGSVAVNHSIEGPIPDPVALSAEIENATGDHHTAAEARDGTLKAALESSQTDLQDYLSAKERRRGQPGLKLLSFRLTVSLPSASPARLTWPRAILGNAAALHRDA